MKKIFILTFLIVISFAVSCSEPKCTEHLFGEWQIKTEATCINEGLEVRSCERCEFEEENIIAITDHSFGEWVSHDILPEILINHERRDCKTCDLYETRFETVKTKLGTSTFTYLENTTGLEGVDGRQGGCYNGKNFYQAFISEDESTSFIAKKNIESGETIFSEPRAMGHANDMTYHPELNQVLVCDSEFKVYFYDADTLEYIKEIVLTTKVGAISYNAYNNTYTAYGNSKEPNIYTLDENFNVIGQFELKERKKTAQGIYSDDTYVYSLFTPFVDGSREYHIIIHDHNGNHIASFNVAASSYYEAENLSIVDGKFYITICTPNPNTSLCSIVPYPS